MNMKKLLPYVSGKNKDPSQLKISPNSRTQIQENISCVEK